MKTTPLFKLLKVGGLLLALPIIPLPPSSQMKTRKRRTLEISSDSVNCQEQWQLYFWGACYALSSHEIAGRPDVISSRPLWWCHCHGVQRGKRILQKAAAKSWTDWYAAKAMPKMPDAGVPSIPMSRISFIQPHWQAGRAGHLPSKVEICLHEVRIQNM